MQALTRHEGKVAFMPRAHVDTDQIIPKQFLKRIERTGYEDFLFYDWRYLEDGSSNPEFELNQPKYQGASILAAGSNFGCGSSREHAVWALRDYGFRVILAPSFADIFYNNCFKNGLLPIALSETQLQVLHKFLQQEEDSIMAVDVQEQVIEIADGMRLTFEIEDARKERLLEGLDDIGVSMRYQRSIDLYEQERKVYQYTYGA